MNTRQAMQALLLGAKIRSKKWSEGFIYLNEKGSLVTSCGDSTILADYIDYERLPAEAEEKQRDGNL